MGFIINSLGPKPAPRSAGENEWVESSIQLMRSAVGSTRTNRWFIAQSGSGSATGGSGAGTFASPFLVRHLADLRSLMVNNSFVPQVANTEILLRSGDVFRPDTGNIANSWLVFPSLPNWTLNTYSRTYTADTSSNGRLARSALLLGSIQVGSGGWTADGTYTNLQFRAVTQTVYHVWYSHLDPIDGLAFGLSPNTFRWYGRLPVGANLTTALTAMNNAPTQDSAVYDTTNQRLYVRFRTGRTNAATDAILEASISQNAGVELGLADNHCIRNIAAVGFGMDADNGVKQRYCIHVSCSGTQKAVVENCVTAYSGHHAIGHLQTSGGGGSVLFHNCVIGFCQGDTGGNSTPHVSYSNNGGHEGIVSYCQFPFGNIRSVNAGPSGSGTSLTTGTATGHCNMIYGHSGASGAPFDLLIGYRCTVAQDAVNDGGSTVFLGSGEARGVNARPDHEAEATWQRCVFIECSIPDGPLSFASGLGVDCCYSGCDINISTNPANDLFFNAQADADPLPANTNNILFVGSRLQMSSRRLFTSAIQNNRFIGGCFSVGDNKAQTSVFIGFANCDIILDGRANHFFELFGRFRTTQTTRSFLLNTAFSVVNQRDENPAQNMLGLTNRNIVGGDTGGARGCAFFGIREIDTVDFLGYNLTGSPTTLSAPFGPNTIIPAAEPHLPWLRPQVNLYGDPFPVNVVGPYGSNFPSRPSTRFRTFNRPTNTPFSRS
jgi:hypothetical protein